MRVFIRKKNGSQYLAERDQWVPSRNDGLDFVSSIFALEAVTRMKLNDIEILLDFGNLAQEVVLKIPDRSKDSPGLR